MPLQEPPRDAGSLARLPAHPLRGRKLYRVWRNLLPDGTERASPWRFASLSDAREACGRFDLSAPMGTCYLATRPEAALLEALQMHLTNLPAAELGVRRIAEVRAPDDAPPAAMLTAESVAGDFGITAAIWAGLERRLTQRWGRGDSARRLVGRLRRHCPRPARSASRRGPVRPARRSSTQPWRALALPIATHRQRRCTGAGAVSLRPKRARTRPAPMGTATALMSEVFLSVPHPLANTCPIDGYTQVR